MAHLRHLVPNAVFEHGKEGKGIKKSLTAAKDVSLYIVMLTEDVDKGIILFKIQQTCHDVQHKLHSLLVNKYKMPI